MEHENKEGISPGVILVMDDEGLYQPEQTLITPIPT